MPSTPASIGPPSHRDVTREVLDWCDRSATGIVRISCANHGLVGTIDVSRMPEDVTAPRHEDTRLFYLARVAHYATMVESRLDGAPAAALIGDDVTPDLADGGGRWRWPDVRSNLDSGFRPWPIPEEALAWWRAHRGWVRVSCPVHGEVATFDASRDPRMLGVLWDAALIELDFRWEDAWDGEDEGDAQLACYPRIIPFGGAPEDDLLKALPMLIRYFGNPLWWQYEMIPGFEPREERDDP